MHLLLLCQNEKNERIRKYGTVLLK